MAQNSYISEELIKWYEQNKRELPWRDTSDPYKIWISEIILQQTRVNQGLNYFIRFIARFPNIKSLADADEDEILKYWQGLGYYTRARNLHKTAILISKDYDGIFPSEYNKIIKLAGIGEYTAAAISSFAFNEPFSVLDGNVYRVISRFFGIETPIDSSSGKKEFARLAQTILSVSKPAQHNQAIMEFGALQCIPNSPDCINCPLKFTCRAFELDKVSQLPVKSIKTKVSNRFFNYLFIKYQDSTYLQKRVAKDVWQNLYEFPLIESNHLLDLGELQEDENFKTLFENIDEVEILKTINPMKHILSHRVIYAQFTILKISNENRLLKQFIKTPFTEIDKYAVSRLMELFIESEL